MIDKKITIPLNDDKVAYAKLKGSLKDTVIIFAHGLASKMDSLLPYLSAEFFSKHGFNFLRFNFYDYYDDARDLWDCSLKTHAEDLDAIVDYCFSMGAKKVHVIGHSYGGLTVLMSKRQKFTSAILFDPSHPVSSPFDKGEVKYIKEIDGYMKKAGIDFVYSRTLVEENRSLNPDEYLKSYSTPAVILSAGEGTLVMGGKDYEKRLQKKVRVERHLINGAGHSFYEDAPREELFQRTLQWLKSF